MGPFRRRKAAGEFCSAIICAAGSSSRMGQDKLMMSLCGKPVIIHTIEAFEQSPAIDEIIVVTRESALSSMAELLSGFSKVANIVSGGEQRIDSVIAGSAAISDSATLVAVHDGARPLVSQELISSVVNTAIKYGSAVPAVIPKDTVKQELDGRASATFDRSRLRLAQTPQVFYTSVLTAALSNAKAAGLSVTDDSQAVEALGIPVYFSPGSDENIKLTTPVDVLLAEAILQRRNRE